MPSSAVLIPFDEARHGAEWARWRELAAPGAPFLGPEFFAVVRPLLDQPLVRNAFVAEARGDRELVGALPLVLEGDVLHGLVGEHSPAFDYTGSSSGLEAIWAMLRDDSRWNELVLPMVPAFSLLAARLPAFAERDGCPMVVAEDSSHPYLRLPGFTAALQPKFRTNLHRCERKAGEVTL